MTEHQSSRTLVKSAPELWAECSDAGSLARHLGAFGEIRITKLEPESTVAWEGAAASGTVRLEPSGWGTRVTLTVTEDKVTVEPEAAPEAEPELEREPELDIAPLALAATVAETPRPGLLVRFMLALRRRPAEPADSEEPEEAEAVTAAPARDPAREPRPAPTIGPTDDAARGPTDEAAPGPAGEAALVAALDSLGMAHHRPYSRA
jgi:hypothetical protein